MWEALWLLNQWCFPQSSWRKSYLKATILVASVYHLKFGFSTSYDCTSQWPKHDPRGGWPRSATSCQMPQSWPRGYSNMSNQWIKNTKLRSFIFVFHEKQINFSTLLNTCTLLKSVHFGSWSFLVTLKMLNVGKTIMSNWFLTKKIILPSSIIHILK